jgi:hypothetical protein
MDWSLKPGDTILRAKLHVDFGGSGQGGMNPSAKTNNVFIFTDPEVGRKLGYDDGWSGSAFHYTGEGQSGDQRMIKANKAVLLHHAEGRSVRLFRGSRKTVTYIGEFDLDESDPFHVTDAIQRESSELRKVIVFHMIPKGRVERDARDVVPPSVPPKVTTVPIEAMNSESFATNPSAEPGEAEKREQKLVIQYKEAMQEKGITVERTRFRPNGEARPLFTDLVDEARSNLIEAKGSVTREAIRMAIGQLADYGRFHTDFKRGVLLPERPRKDLEELLESQGIAVIWRNEDGEFKDNLRGSFS